MCRSSSRPWTYPLAAAFANSSITDHRMGKSRPVVSSRGQGPGAMPTHGCLSSRNMAAISPQHASSHAESSTLPATSRALRAIDPTCLCACPRRDDESKSRTGCRSGGHVRARFATWMCSGSTDHGWSSCAPCLPCSCDADPHTSGRLRISCSSDAMRSSPSPGPAAYHATLSPSLRGFRYVCHVRRREGGSEGVEKRDCQSCGFLRQHFGDGATCPPGRGAASRRW